MSVQARHRLYSLLKYRKRTAKLNESGAGVAYLKDLPKSEGKEAKEAPFYSSRRQTNLILKFMGVEHKSPGLPHYTYIPTTVPGCNSCKVGLACDRYMRK